MPSAKGKQPLLEGWIAEHRPARIGEAEADAIKAALAPISDAHLRKLLRSCGVPLDAVVEGVAQNDFDALERTLRALEDVYTSEGGDRARRARACVLTAKQHALWAARRAGGEGKREVLLWLQTWLENPALFSAWVTLRKRQPACLPPRVAGLD